MTPDGAEASEKTEIWWNETLDQVLRGRRVIDFHGLWTFAEDDFLASAQDQVLHRRQVAALDRCEIKISASTPWGVAKVSQIYADGIVFHSTASHGGFHLSQECNALVHPAWRNADGWYEEDYQWARVAASFPDLFTTLERRCAEELLDSWQLGADETIYGAVFQPEQPCMKDDKHPFRADAHADWVVTWATFAIDEARLRPDEEPTGYTDLNGWH